MSENLVHFQPPAPDAAVYTGPDDVVGDPSLTLADKRAILASWVSDAVQKAVDERQPFDDAYEIVRRMAGPADGELPSDDDDSRDAALFVRMLNKFPPPTMRRAPQPLDEADAEALGGAFLP